ncbi:MAG: hypothetical protein WCH77_14480 [Planctomycetota bacterium]
MTGMPHPAKTNHRPAPGSLPWLRLVSAGVISILLAGCGPGVPAGKVKLTGTVTFDGKPLVAGVLSGGVINFAAKQGNASGSAALSPEGAFTVYLEPGENDVAVRDNGGTERASPAGSGGERDFYPVVIPARFTSADTSGISVTAEAGSKPVTIAIEKQ